LGRNAPIVDLNLQSGSPRCGCDLAQGIDNVEIALGEQHAAKWIADPRHDMRSSASTPN